jgi:class 3 adenylate cyclase/tetratricopeptide (TPR) repeat protein
MVTTLFTDLVDSTALASRLGPERAEELRRVYYGLLRAAVVDAAGTEVKSTGDGLHAVFPTVSSALACAVATQQAIDRHNQSGAEPLMVRVGISHGEAERSEDGDYYGASVVEAARLCAKALGGEIMTTELVRALCGGRGDHRFETVGELELKGLGDPVSACRVLWTPVQGPSWSVPLPGRLDPVEDAWFVGRASELARLTESLKAVGDGGRRVVLVSGEAGIGKTSLVAVAARRAHEYGAMVLYGRCDEELGIPYQPWAEALGQLVEHALDALLRGHVDDCGGDLATLVPALETRLGGLPPARSSDPDAERHLLFAAALDLLVRASSDAPILIVLDDLHWADRPTLQLLRHVVSGSASLPLMIVGTFRPGDVGADIPLAELLAALHREAGVERMTLVGLDDLELLSLLESAAGHEMPAEGVALRDALAAETDGNPFFVREILRHLAETGAIGQQDGRWVARTDLSAEGLPVSVREVIGRRVHRLGPDATRVLGAASVIGRDFDTALLGAVVDLGEDRLLDVLDAARAAAIIADAPDWPGGFTFVHALIQHALNDELSVARCQHLHRRIAEALECLPGGSDERVGELALHWYAATQPADLDKAIRYSIAAGDRAERRLAPDEAVRWYLQALELLDRLDPGVRVEQRCDLLLRLGTAQRLAGLPEFRDTLLDAADLAQREGDTDHLVQAALRNTRTFAASIGRLDAARVTVLRGALDAIGTTSPETRACLLARFSIETIWVPDYNTDALIDEALELTETTDDLDARGQSLFALYINYTPQNLESRQSLVGECLDVAELVDPSLGGAMYHGLLHMAMQMGDFDKARAFLKDYERVYGMVGDPTQRWVSEWFQASFAMLSGDLPVAEQRAEHALQIAIDNGEPDALIIYGGQLAEFRTFAGREAEIVDLIAQGAADNPGVPAYRTGLAYLLAASDRHDEARALLNEMTPELASLPVDCAWSMALGYAARASALIGHHETARIVAQHLNPFVDQWIWSGSSDLGPIALSVATANAVLGNYETADSLFSHAMGLAESATCPYWTALTALEWAQLLTNRGNSGDHQRTLELLNTCITTAQTHNFTGLELRAKRLHEATNDQASNGTE